MKTTTQIYNQRQRLFALFMRTTTARAAKLCPSSGGNQTLCGNWRDFDPGAAAAHAVWLQCWEGWRRIDAASEAAYKLAEHQRHGADFRPLWCEHCKKQRAARPAVRKMGKVF
jgi:hypothetical protein